jgi:hypothetical protein
MAATLNTPTDPDSPSRPGLLAVEPDVMLARDMAHALLLMLEKLMPQSSGPFHKILLDTRDIAALHRAAGMAADAAAAAAEALYEALDSDRVGTP